MLRSLLTDKSALYGLLALIVLGDFATMWLVTSNADLDADIRSTVLTSGFTVIGGIVTLLAREIGAGSERSAMLRTALDMPPPEKPTEKK
jgi:hypothetical protein